jgi:hypothetical protein
VPSAALPTANGWGLAVDGSGDIFFAPFSDANVYKTNVSFTQTNRSSFVVYGLAIATTYTVSMKSVNQMGISASAGTVSGTTASINPPTVTINYVANNAVIFTPYSAQTTSFTYYTSANATPVSFTTSSTYTITGLTANTSYTLYVNAVFNGNSSAFTSSSFTTINPNGANPVLKYSFEDNLNNTGTSTNLNTSVGACSIGASSYSYSTTRKEGNKSIYFNTLNTNAFQTPSFNIPPYISGAVSGYTACLWYYTNSSNNLTYPLLLANAGYGGTNAIGIQNSGDNSLRMYINYVPGSGWSYDTVSNLISVSSNTWYFIGFIVTYGGASNTIKFYVLNEGVTSTSGITGSNTRTANLSMSAIPLSTVSANIYYGLPSGSSYLQGTFLDNVRFYEYPLTETQLINVKTGAL